MSAHSTVNAFFTIYDEIEIAHLLYFDLCNIYCIQNHINEFVRQYITERIVCVFKDSWRVGLSSDGLRSALCQRICR